MDPTLAMALQGMGQGALPGFPSQQQSWTPPAAPPLQQATPQSISPPPMLGQGAPQQQAFNLPGSQPQSPIAKALQPTTPQAAQAGMGFAGKMMPWLMALSFLQQNSSTPSATFGGGRAGFTSSGGGL